jgi:stage II sporulation SpoE-like protein
VVPWTLLRAFTRPLAARAGTGAAVLCALLIAGFGPATSAIAKHDSSSRSGHHGKAKKKKKGKGSREQSPDAPSEPASQPSSSTDGSANDSKGEGGRGNGGKSDGGGSPKPEKGHGHHHGNHHHKGGGSSGGGSPGGGSSGGGRPSTEPPSTEPPSTGPPSPGPPPSSSGKGSKAPLLPKPIAVAAPLRPLTQLQPPATKLPASKRSPASRPGSRSRLPAPLTVAAFSGVAGASSGGLGAGPLTGAAGTAPSAGATGGTPAHPRRAKHEGSPVTRTVRHIVEVVPQSVKTALAALAALAVMLGAGYAFTAFRARRLGRQRRELLDEVGLLQAALLPPVPERFGALRVSVAYRPADGPAAGGDFYDALELSDGRTGFILGDVSGHGRPALARTAFLRYTLRAYLEAGLAPRAALRVAGGVIDDLEGDFATVLIAVHDPLTGSLTYASAGHPAPIVVGPSRFEPVLAASAPPIGAGLKTGLRQTEIPLAPGSVACLYTDGLTEARTAGGILGRGRLGDLLADLGRRATAPELLDRVAGEARLVSDDMATVLLAPTAGVTTGGFRSEQLELPAGDLQTPLAERFLEACGVPVEPARVAIAQARAEGERVGGAVLQVRYGTRGPLVDVLPANVESFEAAARHAHVG